MTYWCSGRTSAPARFRVAADLRVSYGVECSSAVRCWSSTSTTGLPTALPATPRMSCTTVVTGGKTKQHCKFIIVDILTGDPGRSDPPTPDLQHLWDLCRSFKFCRYLSTFTLTQNYSVRAAICDFFSSCFGKTKHFHFYFHLDNETFVYSVLKCI